jgi:hypothetical protein
MWNRRSILQLGIVSGLSAPAQERAPRFRIWDVHSHLHALPGDTPERRMEVLVRCADRLGIERMIVSQGYSSPLHPTPEQLRE